MHRRIIIVLALVASALVALRITPSSYGAALALLGSPNAGLVAAAPRLVRSDEWAVITPAIQATINNHFQRYNATSFYREDLRQIYALPVHDWGLAFRPTMWLFGLVPPRFAFSAYHVAIQLMCVVGFALLFRQSGLGGINAWLLSACIYWSGFMQYFWTTVGPVVAWWPWLTLAIVRVRKSWFALPIVAYVFACWALSFFYPPLLISLGFVTACFVLGFRHNRLPPLRLLACGIACVIGAAVAVFYLRDTLLALNDTFYPGQRRVGGGGLWAEKVVSMFLPFAFIFKGEPYGVRASLPETNICEFGVVGSVYFLFALLRLSPGRLRTAIGGKRRGELLVLLVGLVAVFVWMLVEVPASLGAVLLWDRVPPARMVMAAGVLLALVSAYASHHLATRLNVARLALGLAVILGFVVLKSSYGDLSFRLIGRDLVPALGLIAIFVARSRLTPSMEHTSLLAVAALTNVFCFASFNPLQQADPIFAPPETAELLAWAERAAHQHGRPLLEPFPGRVLNGLGFSAISHVEATPQMPLWRTLLPEVDEATLQSTFNRYAHIIVTDEEEVRSPQPDVALLPRRLIIPGVERRAFCEPSATPAGTINARREQRLGDGRQQVSLDGMVPASGIFRDQRFMVVGSDVFDVKVSVSPEAGPPIDNDRDAHAFALTIELPAGRTFDAQHTCVLFSDQRRNTTVALDDPSVGGECEPCLAP